MRPRGSSLCTDMLWSWKNLTLMNRKFRWRFSNAFPGSREEKSFTPVPCHPPRLSFPPLPRLPKRHECQCTCPRKRGGAHSSRAIHNKMQDELLNHPPSQQSRSAKTTRRLYLNYPTRVRSCAHASRAFRQNLF